MVMLSFLVFGVDLYEYRNIHAALASILSLVLGKFSYARFESSNRVMGAIFYFMFNIMINWIIVNMLVSILIDAFSQVRKYARQYNNEHWKFMCGKQTYST